MIIFYKTKVNTSGNTYGAVIDTNNKTVVYGWQLRPVVYDEEIKTTRKAIRAAVETALKDNYKVIER